MEIMVNGEPREVTANYTVTELLEDMGLAQRRLAVEVNEEIIPRSQHNAHQLKVSDRIEIVHAIGGG